MASVGFILNCNLKCRQRHSFMWYPWGVGWVIDCSMWLRLSSWSKKEEERPLFMFAGGNVSLSLPAAVDLLFSLWSWPNSWAVSSRRPWRPGPQKDAAHEFGHSLCISHYFFLLLFFTCLLHHWSLLSLIYTSNLIAWTLVKGITHTKVHEHAYLFMILLQLGIFNMQLSLQ